MARLALSLLGPFEATLDGEPIGSFRSAKVQALLAYLAVEADRPHRRDALAALLWPERPDRAARVNLRRALAILRKAIGDRETEKPILLVTHQTIQFDIASDHWLDVGRFAECVNASGPVERSPRRSGAAARLEEAVALYRGSFLEGFSLKGCLEFDDWSLLVRERLHRQALTALSRLAERYEQRGEIERARETARQRVELEPWEEEAHRQLLRLLALGGQRTEALAQYETCRRILREELCSEPERETKELYKRIRDGEALRAVRPSPPDNLPAQLFPFVGREAEVAGIVDRLQDPACRLLTLVGPGGSGKTRLALEAAADILSSEQVDGFEEGIFFVSLAPLRSVDGLIPTVAAALGLAFHGAADPRQQLLDYLGQKHLLLILDNFEHLLPSSPPSGGIEGGRKGGARLVVDILRAAPDVKILVTSRARLRVQGEVLFQVGGMDTPQSPTVIDPLEYSAVQLFVQSAQRGLRGLELQAGDLEPVAHICGLVAGMPLGILLAAAWLGVLTPAEIAEEIEQGLDFLKTGLRDTPERQRSMRAVFEHSWNLLTERQREILAGFSVFCGGFTRQAAQRVTGVSLRNLKALVDRSLVQRSRMGRYEMHELLRQYSEERLDASPTASVEIHDRHCATYVTALEQWGRDLKRLRQRAALAEMDTEIENARSAWYWAAQQGQVERLDRAGWGLYRYHLLRGRFEECEAACAAAAKGLEGIDSPDAQRVLVSVLRWQGACCWRLGRSEAGRQLVQRGMALLDGPALAEHDTRAERAAIISEMADVASNVDADDVQARRYREQTLALYQELGDQWGAAGAMQGLAWCALGMGDYQEATQRFKETLALNQALGDSMRIGHSYHGLARVALRRARYREAETLLRRAREVFRELGDALSIQIADSWLSDALVFQGKFTQALGLLEESVAACGYLPFMAVEIHYTLGHTEKHLGHYERARAHGDEGLAIAREHSDHVGTADSLILLSESLMLLGHLALATEGRHQDAGMALFALEDEEAKVAYAEAKRLLEEGTAVIRKTDEPVRLASGHIDLGVVAIHLGEPQQGQQHLSRALGILAETEALPLLLISLSGSALLLADAGEHERAVELYALASRYPYVGNSRWFEDVFGRHIDAIAATLPPEVAEAARERGHARDLDETVKELLEELAGETCVL